MMTHERKIRWLRGITAAFSVICACTLFGTKVYAADAYQVRIPTSIDVNGKIGQVSVSQKYTVTVEDTGGVPEDKQISLTANTEPMYAQNHDGTNSTKYEPLSLTLGPDKQNKFVSIWKKAEPDKQPGPVQYDINGTVKVAGAYKGNITYQAAVTQNADYRYKITYQDGVQNGSASTKVINPNENIKYYTVNSDTIKLQDPSRKGYDFIGWTGSNGTTPQKGVTIPKGSTGDKTYTANWEIQTYTISYTLDGHGQAGAWPYTYTVEYDDISVGSPAGLINNADHNVNPIMYFTGWTGSPGISADGNTIMIKRGSTGNRSYKANWNAGGFKVSCEDWLIDWNGDPYQKITEEAEHIYLKPGLTASPSHWTSTPTRWSQFFKNGPDVTVSDQNTIVYRYFKLLGHTVNSSNWRGDLISFSATVHLDYYNHKGELIHSESHSGIQTSAQNYRRQTLPAGLKVWIDGFKKNAAGQIVSERGDTLLEDQSVYTNTQVGQNTAASLVWNGGQDATTYNVYPFVYCRRWDEHSHSFYDYSVWYRSSDHTYWDVSGTRQVEYMNPYKSITLQTGNTSTTYTDPLAITGDDHPSQQAWHITDMQLKPGYVWYADNYTQGSDIHSKQAWMIYYGGGIGSAGKYGKDILTTSFVLDAPVHLHFNGAAEDAYAVAFNANGGVNDTSGGTTQYMYNERIKNTDPDSARHLTKNTFVNPGHQFLGWSRDKNAAEAEYADGAVMPKNLTNAGRIVTLYAVWK